MKKIKGFQLEFEQECSLQSVIEPELMQTREVPLRIVCDESKSIPPLSMVPVGVHISGSLSDEEEGVIEPSKKVMMERQLSVGRTYVAPAVKVETLLITNFSNVPQWINTGMSLGQLQSAKLVQINSLSEVQEPSKVPIPESLFRDRIGTELGKEDSDRVLSLLLKYTEYFAVDNSELGRCNIAKHSIDTGRVKPIRQLPYNNAWKQREIIQREVGEMLDDGVISPSISPWASPVVLVLKPDGT